MLASKLGVSREGVAKLIKQLRTEQILRGISAQVNFSRLGLESVVCLLHSQPDNWPFLERLCLQHPYTRYKIRCLGPFNALLAQFTIPSGTIGLLMDLFEKLVDRGRLESYDLHLPIAEIAQSETDFRLYTPGKGWVFDWQVWENSWERRPPPLRPLLPSILDRLDEGDMRTLREISLDMFRPQTEIANAAEVTEPKLSRRLVFYRDQQIITGYRVLAGKYFLQGLASVALFRCRSNLPVTKRIAAALPLVPFQCTLVPEPQGFVLYATLSSLDIPQVSGILKRHCSSVETSWCDYLSSFRWSLDPYPFQSGQWRSDYDFMVTDVLRQLATAKSAVQGN
jgi:DNA-binding Lrp family transcriptional regulator